MQHVRFRESVGGPLVWGLDGGCFLIDLKDSLWRVVAVDYDRQGIWVELEAPDA